MAQKLVSLPKNHWMPDVMATTCYRCEKNFNSFRRRHHCRYCGLLFCANCTKIDASLPNGECLDRICFKCFEVLTATEVKPDQRLTQYPYFPKDNSVFIEEDVEDATTEANADTNFDLGDFFNEENEFNLENPQFGDYGNSEHLENYLASICKNSLNDIGATEFYEVVKDTVRETVRSIKPMKKDALNLNKYLRVINFPTENKCKFFKGLVFQKGLASKKMIERITNPKILILSGSSGFFLSDKKIVSMEKVVDQEENYTKIFLELLTNNIQPNLIIVEKSMPFNVIDELLTSGISVIMNMKLKFLKLISRLITGKVLGSINQAFYQKPGYLGNCSQFWQQRIGDENYIFFQAAEEVSLCGSVLFNPMGLNKNLYKETIMKLCMMYRSALLEKAVLDLFGVKSADFISFHSYQSSFIHLSTSRGRICSRPKVHQVEYYSKNGKALGDFFKFNLVKVLEKCTNFCEKQLFTHIYYYYKGQGRVRISHLKPENSQSNIQVCRLCQKCGKQSTPCKLSSLAWKFSFNKFIDNFFQQGTVEHETCSHDFYTEGKFLFTMSSHSVQVEYEANSKYSVEKNIKYSNELIMKLLVTAKEKLLESGSSLIAELKMVKDYILNLTVIEFTEANNEEDAVHLNKLNKTIDQSFTTMEMIFTEIHCIECENLFQVEALRRNLFLEFCKIILAVECVFDFTKKNSLRKGQNSGVTSAHGSISSPHDISNILSVVDRFDFLGSKDFSYMQKGLLTFPLQNSTVCVPIDEEDSLTVIAYALNSQEYYKAIEDYQEDPENIYEQIEGDLLSAKEEHFIFTHSNFDENSSQADLQRETFRKLYGDCVSIKVTAYFYKEFHGMRHYCIGPHIDFLLSICQAQKSELHLGKSKAYFKSSVDSRFLLKIVGEKQFRMFMDFAPNYFRHNCKSKFHGMPSCLVKILGAYYVQVKNHSTGKMRQEWSFLSENLCYAMPEKSLTYDLKGTINRRRKVQEGDERTKMDVNFVEYMNGLPILLRAEEKKKLDAEIWNDTLFLSQQNIVDYSLLLLIDQDKSLIRYGIIDYMEQYTFERAIESKYKTVVGTEIPTIILPTEYKNRFRQYLIQIYFMSVD